MIIIGHRGSAGTAPENTLKSLEQAISAGADGVEFDVQACATGELVIIHDRTVDRTTNGRGFVNRLSFEELRRLDAGQGEKIPTLREALDLINNRVEVYIELKGDLTSEKTAKLVNQCIKSGQYSADSFVISSFNHNELLNFRNFNTDCRLAALVAHTPLAYAKAFRGLNTWSLNVKIDYCFRAFVRAAHKRGRQFLVYTVNEIEDRDRLKKMGVDGVFTNYPAKLCENAI